MDDIGTLRRLQLNELEQLRGDATFSSRMYKEKMKAFHDKYINRKNFQPGQKVWLFNSRLKLFPGKLRSRWDGPFIVKTVTPFGAVEIRDTRDNSVQKVNGQRLKHYIEGIHDGEMADGVNFVDPVYPDDN
ncbi:hypothetical protein Dimus_039578 [Dionaea muscipula]